MRTTGYLTSDPGRHVTAVIPYKVDSRPQVIIIVSPPRFLFLNEAPFTVSVVLES